MRFSIVIPAHNEEGFLPEFLDSFKRAGAAYPDQVEVIAVLNAGFFKRALLYSKP